MTISDYDFLEKISVFDSTISAGTGTYRFQNDSLIWVDWKRKRSFAWPEEISEYKPIPLATRKEEQSYVLVNITDSSFEMLGSGLNPIVKLNKIKAE